MWGIRELNEDTTQIPTQGWKQGFDIKILIFKIDALAELLSVFMLHKAI